jgi:hypothetical protein
VHAALALQCVQGFEFSMKTPEAVSWWRALAVWLLIALVESLHGTLRELFLVPVVGAPVAGRIGFVVGSLLVIGVAWATSRWLGATRRAALLGVGALWAALMLGFELALGRARGFGWARIAAEFEPSQGGLMGFGLLLMLFAPMLGAWLRRR